MRQSALIKKIDNPSAVGVTTVTLPRNITAYGVRVKDNGGNVLITDISKVEVIKSKNTEISKGAVAGRSGETVLWSLTGQQLDELNKVDNLGDYASSGNLLKFVFENNKLKLPHEQYAHALTILNDETLRLEITTANHAPAWAAYVDYDDVLRDQKIVRRIRAYQKDLSGGEDSTDNVPYGDRERKYWLRLFIKPSAGAITNTRLTLGTGNTEVYNRATSVNQSILADLGFTPGAYWGDIVDFAETGVLEAIDLAQYKSGDQNVNIFTTNANPATNIYLLESLGLI